LGKGGFAEYAIANDANIFPIPDDFNWVDAATVFIAYGSAHVCLLKRCQIQSGETLLVHGAAGGVGAAIIHLGRHLGARIIATEVGAKKVEACRKLGAEIAIDALSDDFVSVVNDTTGGRGADMIFDPVGGEVFEKSLDCIANEGRLVIIGYASGKWFDAPSLKVVLKNISVVGAFLGIYDKMNLRPIYEYLLPLFANNQIGSIVERVISFEEIPSGLTDIATHKAIGRIVAEL
jgi:NADPH2:quinone reductase